MLASLMNDTFDSKLFFLYPQLNPSAMDIHCWWLILTKERVLHYAGLSQIIKGSGNLFLHYYAW